MEGEGENWEGREESIEEGKSNKNSEGNKQGVYVCNP